MTRSHKPHGREATCCKSGCARLLGKRCRIDLTGHYFCNVHGSTAQRFARLRLPCLSERLSDFVSKWPQYRFVLSFLRQDLLQQLLKWSGASELSGGVCVKPAMPKPRLSKRQWVPKRMWHPTPVIAVCQMDHCSAVLGPRLRTFGEHTCCRPCYERRLRRAKRAEAQWRSLVTACSNRPWLERLLNTGLAARLRKEYGHPPGSFHDYA